MKPALARLFDLRSDQADAAIIDTDIRNGVEASGTNLWILIFAILVASIGLDVNSTAVIIGAMLISPLMGPIIAIGYGAGINDAALIKRALLNLGIFVFISLATATLYFTISPLSQAHSEIIARTTPTLWDVLIAFFGGSAGIVAATRREKSNVVPGVAIATALMPPLCTAGYGLATGNVAFFAGAFYLFSINSVFIAAATLLFVKLLKLPAIEEIDEKARRRSRLLITLAITATLLPSTWLAYRLVGQEIFSTTANRVVSALEEDQHFIVLARDIEPGRRTITLTVGGEAPPDSLRHDIEQALAANGIGDAKVSVRYSGARQFDVSSLKQELQQDLYRNTLRQLEQTNARASSQEAAEEQRLALLREIRAQYPEAQRISVAHGEQNVREQPDTRAVIVVALTTDSPILPATRARLDAWLKTRFAGQTVELLTTTENAAATKRQATRQ